MKKGKQEQNNFNNDFNFNFNDEMTVNGFLNAISEIEYPQYLLDAVSTVQEWLRDLTVGVDDEIDNEIDNENEVDNEIEINNENEFDDNDDEDVKIGFEDEDIEVEVELEGDPVEFLRKIFDDDDFEEIDIDEKMTELFKKIDEIDDKVDVLPNTHKPVGNKDAIVISVLASECEGGLRMAIDYAAVFNRKKCKRIWIISDTFIFDEAARFAEHIDALEKQGISMRFILVNPWGWVELPLSRASAAKKQFTWHGVSPLRDNSDKLNGD